MIHRTYTLSTAQVCTELGIGVTDATFADLWQPAHTLLHSQQHLQSIMDQCGLHWWPQHPLSMPAAPFARATFFINWVWVLQFQPFSEA